MQVAEALLKYGREMGARVAAGLRRPADRPAAARPATRRRRRRRDAGPGGRPSQARQPAARRGPGRHPRRGRRDARHGLRRGPRGDPLGDARRSPDRALLGDDLADHHPHRQAAPARPGPDQGPCREGDLGDGVARVRQVAYVVRRTDKLAALCRILDVEDPTSTLVFARTRGEVDDLAEALSARGHDAGALHGGLTQEARDRIMGRFRDGSLDVLVATDVAARGLDIEHVSHVVNFDVPSNPDAYVHRIGRTGRAGREGVAITLVEPREHRLLRNIEAATHTKLEIAQAADGRRPARAPDRDPPRQSARGPPRRRLRPVPRRRRAADRRIRPGRHRARRGQPDRGRRRPRSRRGRAASPPLVAPGPPPRIAARRRVTRAGPPRLGRPGRAVGSVGRRRAARPTAAGSACSSVAAGGRASGRATSSARSPTRRTCPGSVVGAIQINEGFSLVDVQEGVADAVVAALATATIRGRRMQVRRDRRSEARCGSRSSRSCSTTSSGSAT